MIRPCLLVLFGSALGSTQIFVSPKLTPPASGSQELLSLVDAANAQIVVFDSIVEHRLMESKALGNAPPGRRGAIAIGKADSLRAVKAVGLSELRGVIASLDRVVNEADRVWVSLKDDAMRVYDKVEAARAAEVPNYRLHDILDDEIHSWSRIYSQAAVDSTNAIAFLQAAGSVRSYFTRLETDATSKPLKMNSFRKSGLAVIDRARKTVKFADDIVDDRLEYGDSFRSRK